MRIILASKSPRRRELISSLFSDFEIITADADESLDGEIPALGVGNIARKKGRAVLDLISSSGDLDEALIISSDTLVELDNIPLGKPRDDADAYRMLKSLSGRAHNVHTGVAVHYRGRVFSGVASTKVHFRELSDEEIYDYIATGEPADKAGAYGIQGLGGEFVRETDGDFDTVVGLSLRLTKELLYKAAGLEF